MNGEFVQCFTPTWCSVSVCAEGTHCVGHSEPINTDMHGQLELEMTPKQSSSTKQINISMWVCVCSSVFSMQCTVVYIKKVKIHRLRNTEATLPSLRLIDTEATPPSL